MLVVQHPLFFDKKVVRQIIERLPSEFIIDYSEYNNKPVFFSLKSGCFEMIYRKIVLNNGRELLFQYLIYEFEEDKEIQFLNINEFSFDKEDLKEIKELIEELLSEYKLVENYTFYDTRIFRDTHRYKFIKNEGGVNHD
ncbi:MAG: hypothetical protein JHC31_01290 [Sulfurihydrogenibium sp.]|nr:hypothetical protein [Sulfurihydrogenibium sp.]